MKCFCKLMTKFYHIDLVVSRHSTDSKHELLSTLSPFNPSWSTNILKNCFLPPPIHGLNNLHSNIINIPDVSWFVAALSLFVNQNKTEWLLFYLCCIMLSLLLKYVMVTTCLCPFACIYVLPPCPGSLLCWQHWKVKKSKTYSDPSLWQPPHLVVKVVTKQVYQNTKQKKSIEMHPTQFFAL